MRPKQYTRALPMDKLQNLQLIEGNALAMNRILRRFDYGAFLMSVGAFVDVSGAFFVSVLGAAALSQPTNATLMMQTVSRIAVNFFIDASLWVKRSHFASAHRRADLD